MWKNYVKLSISMAVLVTTLLSHASSDEVKCRDETLDHLQPCLSEMYYVESGKPISISCCDIINGVAGDCAGSFSPHWFTAVQRFCVLISNISEEDERENKMSQSHNNDENDSDSDYNNNSTTTDDVIEPPVTSTPKVNGVDSDDDHKKEAVFDNNINNSSSADVVEPRMPKVNGVDPDYDPNGDDDDDDYDSDKKKEDVDIGDMAGWGSCVSQMNMFMDFNKTIALSCCKYILQIPLKVCTQQSCALHDMHKHCKTHS